MLVSPDTLTHLLKTQSLALSTIQTSKNSALVTRARNILNLLAPVITANSQRAVQGVINWL